MYTWIGILSYNTFRLGLNCHLCHKYGFKIYFCCHVNGDLIPSEEFHILSHPQGRVGGSADRPPFGLQAQPCCFEPVTTAIVHPKIWPYTSYSRALEIQLLPAHLRHNQTQGLGLMGSQHRSEMEGAHVWSLMIKQPIRHHACIAPPSLLSHGQELILPASALAWGR